MAPMLVLALPATLALAAASIPMAAAQTAAGTTILNVARLSYGSGTEAGAVASNTVSLPVLRVVDVTVTAARPQRAIGAGGRDGVVFTVRNAGNAAERFTLSVPAVLSPAAVAGIVADAPGASPSAPGASAAIALEPGEERTVTVLVDGAAAVPDDVPVTLVATAQAGSGTPGTPVAGTPEGIVGATGARAGATTVLTHGAVSAPPAPAPGEASPAPTLSKSQSVRAPDGSARVMPGSVITYRLEARFPLPTADVAVDDPIPAGTAYVPGSLTLDGAALSDADDGDAGALRDAAIHVALGDVGFADTSLPSRAIPVRVVQFQAVIQ